ncbi:hypothetical protein MVES_003668 [Malassezia vespertilionis]|uniref:Uncharacterized protein n=1 Tax=Malassezia vespertilionis TaxID=2020962 RepID=A0A2N1J7F5_9BASI|nr:hypothetical protein MVES_003668 [Malassezia vespertilionis]
MASRIAALKALYESKVPDASDTYMEQSLASFQHENATLSLDSSGSMEMHVPETDRATSLFSSVDESVSSTKDERSTSADAIVAESSATPRKPSMPQESATPTAKRTDTPTHTLPSDEGSFWDMEESLSASLRTGHFGQDPAAALDDDEEERPVDRSVSGEWGVQEMKRRTAAGISMKSTREKIDQLTAERDDLKIEVDFHRRNMSPDDVGAEVISLRQEKLGYVRRLQKLNELVKGQDQALKAVNKQVKGWEHKLQDYDALQEQLHALTSEIAALRAQEPSAALAELEARHRAERETWEEQLVGQTDLDRDTLVQDLRADLQDAEREIVFLRRGAASSPALDLQREVDEQHESIGALQDALAAERLLVAEKEGEVDRLNRLHEESQAALAMLQHQVRDELHETQRGAQRAQLDLAHVQEERDHLALALDRHVERRRELEELNARLNEKLVQVVTDLKEEEVAREQVDTDWSQRYDTSEARTQRTLHTKNDLIESLEQQLVQVRGEQQRQERELSEARRALQANTSHGRELDAERAEHAKEQRHAAQLAQELATFQAELARKDERCEDAEEENARLSSETAQLAKALQAETRTRLSAQERLEHTEKALEEARHDLTIVRARRDELDARKPATNEAQARAKLAERNALLSTVYDSLVKALNGTPSTLAVRKRAEDDAGFSADARLVGTHFAQFHDRLKQQIRHLSTIQTGFTHRAKSLEREQLEQLTNLRREQEHRFGQMERVERSIKAAAEKQAQWRKRMLDNENELGTLQRANASLQSQLARLRDGASVQAPSDSPARWSVRLRELESRVREADERVKRERLGAKERAARDDARIRYLQALLNRLHTPPAP